MTDMFISYARKDIALARRLHAALEGAGRTAWIDWEGIPPSADWWAEICSAIEAAQACVLLLTPRSVASVECQKEVDHALRQKKRLIPLLADDVEPASVADAQRRLNWIDIRPDAFETGFAQLIVALDTDLDRVREHTRLLVRATEWHAKDRDHSLLLGGKDLRAAQVWLAADHALNPEPTALQTEFIVASAQAESRRQRLTLGATTLALVISVSLAAWAYRERGIAQRQTQLSVANNLLVESRSERHAGPQGAQLKVLLGIQALERLGRLDRPTSEALEAMDAAASLRARHLSTARVDAVAESVAMSGDGSRVLSWKGNRVTWRSTADLTQTHSLAARAGVTSAVLSRDGQLAAVGDHQGVWLHRMAAAGVAGVSMQGCTGPAAKVEISAGTGFVVALVAGTQASEGKVCVWSAAEGRLSTTVQLLAQEPATLLQTRWAFSRDERWLAVRSPGVAGWQVSLHDLTTAVPSATWDAGMEPPLIEFRDDKLVVADRSAVWTWSTATRQEISRWQLEKKWRTLEISPDGRKLSIALFTGRSWVMDSFAYGVIGVFDSASGVQLAELPAAPHSFSPDSRHLIRRSVVGGFHEFLELPSLRAARYVVGAERLLVADDARSAVGVGADGSFTTWSLADAPLIWQATAYPSPKHWALSRDAGLLAVASSQHLEVVDLGDASRSWRADAGAAIHGVVISNDARTLAAIAGTGLLLWDLPSMTRPRRVELGESPLPAEDCALLDRACKRRNAEPPTARLASSLRFSADGAHIWHRGQKRLRGWDVADARKVFETAAPPSTDAWLATSIAVVVGRDGGSVEILNVATGQPQRSIALAAPGPLQRLVHVGAGASMLALFATQATAYGMPMYPASSWTAICFDISTGEVTCRRGGLGLVGPWSADGRRFVVQSAGDKLEIFGLGDEPGVPVRVTLRQSVVQTAHALGFTADGRFLLVESETPVTGGRAEPTLHVVDSTTGKELARLPERKDDATRLDRDAAYPEYFLARPSAGLVAGLEYENADQFWGVGATRSRRDLVLWHIGDNGQFATLFRKAITDDARPADLSLDGEALVLAPVAAAEAGAGTSLQVWGLGPRLRLSRACMSVDGDLDADQWQRYVGVYTGEVQRPVCAPLHRARMTSSLPAVPAAESRR